MAIHYFHCTDGVDLILDREGRDVSDAQERSRCARAAADRVMQAVPAYDDWEDWAVYVYDARGQVGIVPFRPDLEPGCEEAAFPDRAAILDRSRTESASPALLR